MIELSLEFDVSSLVKAYAKGVEVGLNSAASIVADEAKKEHPYQNRTGNLEDSTGFERASGDPMSEDFGSSVVATMDYASYLEDLQEFAFIRPVIDKMESQIKEIISRAIEIEMNK